MLFFSLRQFGASLLKFLNRALGIASLGGEVLSSLNALYAKDMFFDKAEELGIFKANHELDQALCMITLHDHVGARPRV